jgi:hypothetical protein
MAYIHENKSFIEQTRIVYLEFSVTVHLLQRSNLFLKVTVKLPLEHKYSVEPSI